MGFMVEHAKCGCIVVIPDGRWAEITLSLGKDCPSREDDPEGLHPPRAKCIKLAKERDERNKAAAAKAAATRARNKKEKAKVL